MPAHPVRRSWAPARPPLQSLPRRAAALLLLLAAALLPSALAAQERGYIGSDIRDVEQAEADALGWDSPRGAMVTAVRAGKPAAVAGIVAGDIILSVDGTSAATAEGVVALITDRRPGTAVILRVLREGKERNVRLVLGTRPASLDHDGEGKKCSKYMPSIGRAIEVPCAPEP